MSNPFDAPQSDLAAGQPAGTLDLGLALRDGWDAMTRNFVPWFGMMLAMFGITLALTVVLLGPGGAMLAIQGLEVGPIAVLAAGAAVEIAVLVVLFPPITWGSTRFTLDALDGTASLGTVFEPLTRLGRTLPSTFAVLALVFLVNLVGSVMSQVIQMVAMIPSFALGSDSVAGMGLQLVGMIAGLLVSTAWSLLVGARFGFALYFLVEDDLAPMDAMASSWRASADAKLGVALLQLAVGLLVIVGVLFCLVGSIPAVMIGAAAQASAFRQLVGRRTA